MTTARKDLLVLGVGNPLRGDDGVGIELVRRLRAHFGPSLNCKELLAPDVILAERIAAFDHLLIIDALAEAQKDPYRLVALAPAKTFMPAGCMVSHCFDWPAILALAEELYGHAPKTQVLGIAARRFEFSESMSSLCQKNADSAFDFLVSYCEAGQRPSSEKNS
ncbi:MAG: hydrogenase maturation protease [Desulfobacterales bacterium]|nr:hydrogenase maturation protease [Desulfobacterales bacterium]